MKTSLFTFMLFLLLMFPLMAKAQEHGMLPADHINKLAHDSQDNDPQHIRALADAAVNPFAVPGPIAEQFRVRLTEAEQKYRQGKHPGVTEEELVSFHNQVVKALGLPDFAETDQRQIRDLRMTLQYNSPALMAPKHGDPKSQEIDPVLSPMAAAHLETMMIFQKYMSPMFQLHPRNWSVETANQIQKDENEKGLHLDPDKRKAIKPEDDKTTQLAQGIQKGINSLSLDQGIELLNDAKRTFKF